MVDYASDDLESIADTALSQNNDLEAIADRALNEPEPEQPVPVNNQIRLLHPLMRQPESFGGMTLSLQLTCSAYNHHL